jgi:DNA-binding IclR family transcriptional regulator
VVPRGERHRRFSSEFHYSELGTIIRNMPSVAGTSRAERETGVGVLDRSVAILEAVERGARSFTDIQAATGFVKPTTHRLLASLEAHGFLTFIAGHGYAFGPRLLRFGTTAMRDLPLRDLARPALVRLAEVTGESAQLYVLGGDRRICVDAVESTNELRTIVAPGAILPLMTGSGGTILMAFCPQPELEWILQRAGERIPPERIPDNLMQRIATARRRGWANSIGEREDGVASVSAPVRDLHGALIGAVSVSGPDRRLGRVAAKRLAPAVMAAATEIERAMGHRR